MPSVGLAIRIATNITTTAIPIIGRMAGRGTFATGGDATFAVRRANSCRAIERASESASRELKKVTQLRCFYNLK